jgi:hypothetical protein
VKGVRQGGSVIVPALQGSFPLKSRFTTGWAVCVRILCTVYFILWAKNVKIVREKGFLKMVFPLLGLV